jgi:hypothetical protein
MVDANCPWFVYAALARRWETGPIIPLSLFSNACPNTRNILIKNDSAAKLAFTSLIIHVAQFFIKI